MQKIIYYVIYNHKRDGYLHNSGIKTIWDNNVLNADKFFSEDDIRETIRWFPKNEVEIKTIELVIK